jgi:hypothetical protein
MNRREANRLAKQIFMSYGWQALDDFEDFQARHEWTDEEMDLVYDYYKRCADRVYEWLRL